MNNNSSRQLNMDLLRILAAFSVVVLHVSAPFCGGWNESIGWIEGNIFDACFRFGVPVFVMISGRFFLAKEGDVDIKKLWTKHILRLIILFAIWSIAYALIGRDYSCFVFKDCIKDIISGKYHLWYLVMLAGIYMIVPVLKPFVDKGDKKAVEYFIILFFVLQIMGETARALIDREVIELLAKKTDIEMFCGYIGYFVLGYYLYKYPLQKKWRRLLYIFGIVGVVLAAGISTVWSVKDQYVHSAVYDSFSIFTFFVSVALFVAFLQIDTSRIKTGSFAYKLITALSRDTLGLYLMQIFLIEFATVKFFVAPSISIAIVIPVASIVITIIGLAISDVLRRIPFIGEHIV